MKVFISWSGERSRAVADLLDSWIQCVLQATTPWMSSKDIDRGSLWFSEITDQLKDTSIGIVCLTKANKNKPWILFESGALAKGLTSSRVCTFLVDLDSTDISNPLAQFNHTKPNKDELYELIRTLNSGLGEHGLREAVLEQVFETYWPQFETKFSEIISETEGGEVEPERTEENILTEVLRTVRGMDRRVRSLESHNNRYVNELSGGAKSRRALEVKVYSLLKEGLSPEVVHEVVGGEYPRSYIKRAIRAAMEHLESQADNTDVEDS